MALAVPASQEACLGQTAHPSLMLLSTAWTAARVQEDGARVMAVCSSSRPQEMMVMLWLQQRQPSARWRMQGVRMVLLCPSCSHPQAPLVVLVVLSLGLRLAGSAAAQVRSHNSSGSSSSSWHSLPPL